jgi:hypothetical protein
MTKSSLCLTTSNGSVTSRQMTSGSRDVFDFDFKSFSLTLFNSSRRLAHRISCASNGYSSSANAAPD